MTPFPIYTFHLRVITGGRTVPQKHLEVRRDCLSLTTEGCRATCVSQASVSNTVTAPHRPVPHTKHCSDQNVRRWRNTSVSKLVLLNIGSRWLTWCPVHCRPTLGWALTVYQALLKALRIYVWMKQSQSFMKHTRSTKGLLINLASGHVDGKSNM